MAISNDRFIITSMLKLARLETNQKRKNDLLDEIANKINAFEELNIERCADEFINCYEYSYGKLDDLFEEAIAKATDNFTSEFKGRGKEIFRKAYPDKDFEHGIYKMFGTWMRSNKTAIMKKYNIFICTRPNGNAGKIYWIIPND